MNLECKDGKIFTIHCSESFVGVATDYIMSQCADIVVVPNACDATLFARHMARHNCKDTEVLAFSELAFPERGVTTYRNERLLLFAHFIEEWNSKHGADYPVHLAKDLLLLIEEMQENCLGLDALKSLEDGELALYWQKTLHLLSGLSEWCTTVNVGSQFAEQRVHELVNTWSIGNKKVICAGIAFNKLFAKFLKLLLHGKSGNGAIIPYINTDLSEQQWQGLQKGHYQYCIMKMLRDMGIDRGEVNSLGAVRRNPIIERLFNFDIFTPATRDFGLDSCGNIELIACDSEAEEAEKVAEILLLNASHESKSEDMCCHHISNQVGQNDDAEHRHAGFTYTNSLYFPHRRCAAFIGDCSVALRVEALLHSKDEQIRDKGHLLSTLVLSAIDVASSCGEAISILTMLKHPFVNLGYSAERYASLISEFEIEIIRRKSLSGFEAIGASIGSVPHLVEFWDIIRNAISPLLFLSDGGTVHELSSAHLLCMNRLISSESVANCESGEVAKFFLVFSQYFGVQRFSIRKYREICALLLDEYFCVNRNELSAVYLDRMEIALLSGFSGGKYSIATQSSLLSSSMRNELGLPSMEEQSGRILYVLYNIFHAKKLYITKSNMVSGVEPMWMRYLTVLLERESPDLSCAETQNCRVKRHSTQGPDPSLDIRLRAMSILSAEAVETLMLNPYAFYSRYILRMSSLGEIDTSPPSMNFNGIVLNILRDHLVNYNGDCDAFMRKARQKFDSACTAYPYIKSIWWPRFEKIAYHFLEMDKQRRLESERAEVGKSFFWEVNDRIKVVSRCDRVEYLPDGCLVITRYKVGATPSRTDIEYGFAPRAIIEALCAMESTHSESVSFVYWGITPEGIELTELENFSSVARRAQEGIRAFLLKYAQERAPFFPRGDFSRFSEYELLARVRENQV